MMRTLVGILFVVLGCQLRCRKRYWLIAGYDPRTTKNPQPIARMLGGVTLVSGACQVVAAVGSRTLPATVPWPAINMGSCSGHYWRS